MRADSAAGITAEGSNDATSAASALVDATGKAISALLVTNMVSSRGPMPSLIIPVAGGA